MSRFKKKTRVRFLPLLLSLQLFIPNTLLANDGSTNESHQHWKRTAQALGMIQGMGQQMLQAHMQRLQQQQAGANFMAMQRDLSIKQVDPSQVPPIITQNGCQVLEARGNRVNSDLSCEGQFSMDLMNQGTYDALLSVAEQNSNTLSNFLTKGHERFTTQGIGCYDKAGNQLDQQLEARLQMLDSMKESMSRRFEEFQQLAKNDVMEIKKGQALLDGKSGDPTVDAALKDYRFEDQFKDPQCRSFFSEKQFADMGKKGLRGIEETLTNNTSQMQPTAFIAKSSQLEKEIISLGKHVKAKQENSDGIALVKDPFAGFNSQLLSRNSEAVKKVLANSADAINEENKSLERNLKSKIPTDDPIVTKMFQEVTQGVRDGSVDIGFRLSEFERETKNRCLSEYMKDNFGGADGFVKRLQDPNISKKANREADSSFKNYITEILNDDRLTIEAKKRKISQAQAQPANARFGMVTGKSVTVEGKNISASTRMPASTMINMFVDNCVARFDSEPNSKGSTYREIAQEMKSYKNQFSKMKTKMANQVSSNLVNELLRCPSDENTGKSPQTCSADSLKTGSQNFCLRTANACAANINGCMEKAEKLVKTTRQKQMSHVETYRANMVAFKENMKQEFAIVAQNFTQASRELDGLFQMGTMFKMPTNLDLNTTEGNGVSSANTLLKGIDPALEIEDPEKYFQKISKNIDSLRKQVVEHNGQVKQKFTQQIAEYKQSYQKEQQYWEQMKGQCIGQLTQFDNIMAEQEAERNRQYAEQQEAIGEACKAFADFRQNPCPSSGGSVGSLSSDMAAIQGAISEDGRSVIGEIAGSCESFGTASSFSNTAGNRNAPYHISIDEYCAESGPSGESNNCQLYRRYSELYQQQIDDEIAGRNTASSNLCRDQRILNDSDEILCKIMDKNNDGEPISATASYDWIPEADCVTNDEKFKQKIDNYRSAETAAKVKIEDELGCDERESDDDSSDVASRFNEIKEAVMEDLAAYRRNQATSAVGEVQVAACAGMNGGGEVDLTGDPMQQLLRGMQGGNAGAAGFMQ